MAILHLNLKSTYPENLKTLSLKLNPPGNSSLQIIKFPQGVVREDVVISYNNALLIRGVDYTLVYPSKTLIDQYGISGYAALRVNNSLLTGELEALVNYIGGPYQHYNMINLPDSVSPNGSEELIELESLVDIPTHPGSISGIFNSISATVRELKE